MMNDELREANCRLSIIFDFYYALNVRQKRMMNKSRNLFFFLSSSFIIRRSSFLLLVTSHFFVVPGLYHRFDDLLITGATAQIACQALTDLGFSRVWNLL